MSNVYGKNALVTGASRGIGQAVAEALAAAGCHVIACARGFDEYGKIPPEKVAGGGSITRVKMDVTDEISVANVVSALPQIDIAVCCAGMGVAGAAEELPMKMARA